MSEIERIIEAMTAAPDPAAEVVTLERATVEQILSEMEEKDPLRAAVVYLRRVLAEPKVELWAIHSVGPGEQYPCLNKNDAERRAQELRNMGERMKQERIARGESVEHWHDWVTNVIPSPWEPAEHFEIMAEEWRDDADHVRQSVLQLQSENESLRKALAGMLFAFDDGVGLAWSADLLDYARKQCAAEEFKP
ncbi:hypothetical protein [Pseudomonas carnis]|uniref:Uncharacterized protein n=1 Tax=Pseudomonas carnis TaxID=2487355 RepID=A0ABT5RPM9_9PSED|nr:hypothetical protein [Pseudomonas carnis]MDD1947949.1 hypothetical protein [Pseudomonas carnis]